MSGKDTALDAKAKKSTFLNYMSKSGPIKDKGNKIAAKPPGP
jgi:hypothetical protein